MFYVPQTQNCCYFMPQDLRTDALYVCETLKYKACGLDAIETCMEMDSFYLQIFEFVFSSSNLHFRIFEFSRPFDVESSSSNLILQSRIFELVHVVHPSSCPCKALDTKVVISVTHIKLELTHTTNSKSLFVSFSSRSLKLFHFSCK